jgi:hypothetical protein
LLCALSTSAFSTEIASLIDLVRHDRAALDEQLRLSRITIEESFEHSEKPMQHAKLAALAL